MDDAQSVNKIKNTEVTVALQETHKHRRIDTQNIQNITVVWLNNHIDHNNEDNQNTIAQLHNYTYDTHTFTDNDECIEFILDVDHSHVYLIISGSIGEFLLPCVHEISQLDSIFIICNNKTSYEEWTKQWSKIKCVTTTITSICETLMNRTQQCKQNDISMNFVQSKTRLDQLDPSFMYTQLLKEALLGIDFGKHYVKEFVHFCPNAFFNKNEELKNVDQMVEEYYQQTPVWWYTKNNDLYWMINRALRMMDGDLIIRLGFFVNDLHREIQQLHQEQFGKHSSNKVFTVYRGQGLSKGDFVEMKKSKGGLMSFNNFLSTSKDRDVSYLFAESNLSNPDLIGILFIIKVDPCESTAAFASLHGRSYFPDEDEVLFTMQSVFRIEDIKSISDNDRLYEISLELTSDNDKELHALTEHIREKTCQTAGGWYRLGIVLIQSGQNEKAEEIYKMILDESTNNDEKAAIYHQLGAIKTYVGQHDEAIRFYEKSLEINTQLRSPNDPYLAICYHNIGYVYFKMGEYSKAVLCHKKCLHIQQQSLPSNHPHFALSYYNIGSDHYNMRDYPKARSFFEKALDIQQQSLPLNHPHVATSYHNISKVFYKMGDYPRALSSVERCLDIRQQALPPNHPDLATSYNDLGGLCYLLDDYPRALSSVERCLDIRQQALPPNHPDLATSYNNIGCLCYYLRDYPKALSSYEKCLDIQQQLLPPNHPDLATSYNRIGRMCCYLGDHPRALLSYEKCLDIQQQLLPPNHPDLATSYSDIGGLCYVLDDHPRALLYYEKCLDIKQQLLPFNHPDLAASYNSIGNVCHHMGDYPRALSSHEKCLDIRQQSLPSNHPDLAKSYNNIAAVYKNLKNYPKACFYSECAVQIGQQSLPTQHPVLQTFISNLAAIRREYMTA